jgi:hypothetical protein
VEGWEVSIKVDRKMIGSQDEDDMTASAKQASTSGCGKPSLLWLWLRLHISGQHVDAGIPIAKLVPRPGFWFY